MRKLCECLLEFTAQAADAMARRRSFFLALALAVALGFFTSFLESSCRKTYWILL